MKKLLFIDDEPRVLSGMKRMLYAFRHEWTMEFVTTGAEALDRLRLSDWDALITDLKMAPMSGVELLEIVLKEYPTVARIVLSGAAEQSATLSAIGLAHQYLTKPCDTDTLRAALHRALVLRFLPDGTGLQKLIKGVQSLPVLPDAYTELLDVLDAGDLSTQRVADAITRDLAMTAKLLQLVNSAYFGLKREIHNPREAVVYLGTEVVRAIVLSVGVFSQFDKKSAGTLDIPALRDHSLAVASLARKIARAMGLPRAQIEEVFIGGILHDLGAMILACHCPGGYADVSKAAMESDEAQIEAEVRIFGATHAQVGAYLLWFWGLPELTVQLVALHHGPLPARADPFFGPIIAVRAADQITRGHNDEQLNWLSQAGFADSVPDWVALSREVESERRIA
jgi:putative nucleotidyltransferase with HDIG domain